MIDPFFINTQEKSYGRKVNVQDKMDTRDCARLLDYYRMRVGNTHKKNLIFYFKILKLSNFI